LLLETRQHWFNNQPGTIRANGINITRADIQLHGGPSPEYNKCETCQSMEWASRVTQTNRWANHVCNLDNTTQDKCRSSCRKQGHMQWSHCHSNYWFALGCDPTLKAPRMAVFFHERSYNGFYEHGGSHVTINKRRCFAQAAQIDLHLTENFASVDWSKYDIALVHNRREMPKMEKPPVPVIMMCWDPWKGNPQAAINYLRPEYILSPSMKLWTRLMNMPGTKPRLYAAGQGNYFARPNMDKKCVDLVVLGALSSQHYRIRKEFNQQLESLSERYLRLHLHEPGHGHAKPDKPLSELNGFLNVYVNQIGRGKYAVFGPCCGEASNILAMKTYEVLGSGAIPILPEVEDMKQLGIEPFIHYIPFSEVFNNNARLSFFIDNYKDFKHIAVSAVKWHKENADRLLFDGFENVIREATKNRFAKRVY